MTIIIVTTTSARQSGTLRSACAGTDPTVGVTISADSTCTAAFANPPTFTSFSPASARPGATVTIVSTNLSNATGVAFNGHPAESFKIVSDTQLTAVVPLDVGAEAGAITVSNAAVPDGVASSTNFTPLWPQPKIASFAPAKAKAGATVTISGSNFLGVTDVSFNGHSATITGASTDKKLTVTVPDNGDDSGHVTVTTQGATPTGTSSGVFTFLPPPTVTSFTPEDAVVGATITITGSNFTGTTSVLIGGAAAKFKVKSAMQLTATVPTGASNTPQPISVTNAGGTTQSADNFTLDWATPTISHFTSTHGAVGTKVTITGTHFTRATGVSFGGTAAVKFTVVNDTTITAVVPPGAATGKITVKNPGADGQSVTDFTVT